MQKCRNEWMRSIYSASKFSKYLSREYRKILIYKKFFLSIISHANEFVIIIIHYVYIFNFLKFFLKLYANIAKFLPEEI